MRLPGDLYTIVKHHMDGHSDWHIARLNPAEFGPEDQAAIMAARVKFPDAKCVIDPGSGEQFLEFHRDMLRQFKWMVIHTPVPGYVFDEWQVLPPWLAGRFVPGDLEGFTAALPGYIAGPSVDLLGSYIESTPRGTAPFHGVHNMCHALIAAAESEMHPGDERRRDASMVEFSEAPHNEYFWSLHSWIDGMYAAWQVQHGVPVDVSPKKPGHHHHGAPVRITPGLRAHIRRTFAGTATSHPSST
jgi:hypothetical protein